MQSKTLSAYLIGYILCLILTIMAFGIIALNIFDIKMTYILLATLAISQLVIQSICFLRLNTSKQGLWNLLPFIFMLMVIIFLVGGSLWIMYNLNYNMLTIN